jgi:hypothetical protein
MSVNERRVVHGSRVDGGDQGGELERAGES